MKIFACVVLGFIIFVILALVYYLVIGSILFHIVFSRKNFSKRVLRKDTDEKLKEYKVDLCWWNNKKFEKVFIKSFDELKLVGHFYQANSNKTVVIVHGFGEDYRELQPYNKFFYEKNFNVLAVENRTHGESEGKCIGFGWVERKDILSWIDFLNQKNPQNKILLFGLSMGGVAVCSASSEKMPKNVVAIVSDCAFDNVGRQFQHIMKKFNFVRILIQKHLYSYAKRLHGFDIKEADIIKQVKNTKIPILYIHGNADTFVPIENMFNLYNATPEHLREKFVVENAKHAMAYSIAGVLYEKKISDFLKSRTSL